MGLARRHDLPLSQQPSLPYRNNSKRKPWLRRLGTSSQAADLGPLGGGEGQRDSPVDWTPALAAWDLGLLKKLECQEVVFPGVLDYS